MVGANYTFLNLLSALIPLSKTPLFSGFRNISALLALSLCVCVRSLELEILNT